MNTYLDTIKSNDFKAIDELFRSKKPTFGPSIAFDSALSQAGDYQEQCIREYKVEGHDIFDTTKRPDKTIKKDTGETDPNGSPVLATTTVPVARISMPLQKLIVNRRVGFMLSEPVRTQPVYGSESEQEKRLEKMVERIQNDNKMDYRNMEIARRMMSELECAELWYLVENKEPDETLRGKHTLKMKILSPDLGDKLYPLFDEYGDMTAFARGYKIKEGDKEIDHFDVYTSEFEYKYVCRNNLWALDDQAVTMTIEGPKAVNPIPNAVGKIMVIYHSQQSPEWADVQSMINRLEVTSSNHADTNDYFGSPIMVVKGTVKGFAQKGESGKIIEIDGDDSAANYLSWDSSPESVKNEKEDLKQNIYAMSQTPNISFEQMMAIGGQLSGVALKMMFLDAHMAVKNKEEQFGIGLQRRLNLIKATVGAVLDTSLSNVTRTLQLKPIITPYLPQNITETVENLTVAKTGGIISTETAVEINPLIEDKEAEMDRLKNDKTELIEGIEL